VGVDGGVITPGKLGKMGGEGRKASAGIEAKQAAEVGAGSWDLGEDQNPQGRDERAVAVGLSRGSDEESGLGGI